MTFTDNKNNRMYFAFSAGLLSLVMLAGQSGEAFSQMLAPCSGQDSKIAVPVWSPQVNKKGVLSSEPPSGEGLIVYIRFAADNATDDAECLNADPDKLYPFIFPEDRNNPYNGGLAVNLRGNVRYSNGMCVFSGFYKNKPVPGAHQGWIETYFGAVDASQVVNSGRYCLSGQ
ncbi:MAG TPA: hypothetical protein ENJ57_01425 [Rhizobiales bacterium]|nr:hypothetical protein [Hyphomicrobiales bacterium]